jgi:hypothetical protein
MKLLWYSGPDKDAPAAKLGHGIVLHTDDTVCRVLVYNKTEPFGRFLLYGYPSQKRMGTISGDCAERFFLFNKRHYCLFPSFVYSTAKELDPVALLSIYRQFCDNDKDAQFENFLANYETTRAQEEDAITVDKATLSGKFVITLNHEGKKLGKVEALFYFKQIEAGKYQVTRFDKAKMINDVWQLINYFGNPPAKDIPKRMVNNVLSDFAVQLAEQGISFDPFIFPMGD